MDYSRYTAAELRTIQRTKAYRGEVFSNAISTGINKNRKPQGTLFTWIVCSAVLIICISVTCPHSWWKITLLVILGLITAFLIFCLGGYMGIETELQTIKEKERIKSFNEDAVVYVALQHRIEAERIVAQQSVNAGDNHVTQNMLRQANERSLGAESMRYGADARFVVTTPMPAPELIYPERTPANRPLILD